MPPLSSAGGLLRLAWGTLLVALTGLAPVGAGAQATLTGSLTGRVLDQGGSPVAGATLLLEADSATAGARTPAERAVTADAAGTYRFVLVPAGSYRLRAQRIGHRPTVVTGVVVQPRRTTELNVTMTVAAAELAPIVVAAPDITIRREDTDLGTVISAETIQLLPVGLDLRNVVALTPGARRETAWGGATEQANSYRLDGVSINHPGVGGQLLEPNVNWVQTLEVRGLGAGAELGSFQGAVVSVVTRSGSNEREGAIRANVESHQLNSSNVGVAEAVPELSGRRELEAEVSGPIVRDRLFYFASGQLLRQETRVLDQVNDPTQFASGLDERQDLKLFGKLTWQPSSADLVSLTAIGADVGGDRAGRTGFETAEATHDLDATARLATLAWQRHGARTGLDVRLSASGADERLLPAAGPDVPAVSVFRPVDPPTYRNAAFDEERRARTVSASAAWTADFTIGATAHSLTVGAEHATSTWEERRRRAGGLTWRPSNAARGPNNPFLPDDATTWPFVNITPLTTGGEVELDAATMNSAAYVQDDVALSSRVSLHPGVRVGRWEGRLRPADGGPRFTAVRDLAVEPRLGITVDVSEGHNSFVVKGHWGRYHQHLFARMFDRAAGSAAFDNERTWYYDGPAFADPARTFTPEEWQALVAAGQLELVEERVLDQTGPAQDYRQPFVDQWAASVEKTFGPHWKVEGRYISRRNRHAVALVDRNVASNHVAFENVRILDRAGNALRNGRGDTVTVPRVYVPTHAVIQFLEEQLEGKHDGAPGIPSFSPADLQWLTWDPDYVLTSAPGATRRFDQLQGVVSGRLADWSVSGSVIVTRLEGNVDNVSGYDDERSRGPGAWVLPNEQLNFEGPLGETSELEAKLFAVGPIGWGLRGGGVLTLRSGDRSTPTFRHSQIFFDYLPDGEQISGVATRPLGGQEIYVEQRGLYRMPTRALLDLHLERGFPVRGAELALVLDVFNVFGENAVTRTNTRLDSYADTFSRTGYGTARAREAPRTVRVGTALSF